MNSRDKEIGEMISIIRGERSQQSVADAMRERGWKWSQATMWSVEKGERPLRFAEAEDLAAVLGTFTTMLSAQPPEVVQAKRAADLTGEVKADADLRAELIAKWERSINEIADLMAGDATGLVCQTVRNAFPESDVDFDVAVWKGLTEQQRRIVADEWNDNCSADLGIVPVELTVLDAQRLEKKATEQQGGRDTDG